MLPKPASLAVNHGKALTDGEIVCHFSFLLLWNQTNHSLNASHISVTSQLTQLHLPAIAAGCRAALGHRWNEIHVTAT